MRNAGTAVAFAGLGCLPILMVIAFNITIGGLCAEYVVEYWGSYLSGRTVDVPFWVAAVVGLFFGEFFVPAALVTWLVSFALVCTVCV